MADIPDALPPKTVVKKDRPEKKNSLLTVNQYMEYVRLKSEYPLVCGEITDMGSPMVFDGERHVIEHGIPATVSPEDSFEKRRQAGEFGDLTAEQLEKDEYEVLKAVEKNYKQWLKDNNLYDKAYGKVIKEMINAEEPE
jgi:hypothetical protein